VGDESASTSSMKHNDWRSTFAIYLFKLRTSCDPQEVTAQLRSGGGEPTKFQLHTHCGSAEFGKSEVVPHIHETLSFTVHSSVRKIRAR
jgi:hypothetical protein